MGQLDGASAARWESAGIVVLRKVDVMERAEGRTGGWRVQAEVARAHGHLHWDELRCIVKLTSSLESSTSMYC